MCVMCVQVCIGAYRYIQCVYRCPQSSEEDIRSPGAVVTGVVNHLVWVLGAELGSSEEQYKCVTTEQSNPAT